ncbi:hypothetical protein WA026_013122 [Henosepilachna vigintioctopunctata]|uniref:Peptidase S1 domain-containing protein n=1 Tax=Henosepilachna vigintioctopunctata TaxID=420089 RepID=A0AAW1UDQ7_9CUCU
MSSSHLEPNGFWSILLLSGIHINLFLFLAFSRHHAIPNPNIIGGRPAEIWEFPYQVSIQYLTEHNCGGSIISPKFILSAAHCFDE